MWRVSTCFLFAIGCSHGQSTTSATATTSGDIASDEQNTALADIRYIEDHRLSGNHSIVRYLATPRDKSVWARALTAAGRIGDPGYLANITPHLRDAAPGARAAAAHALLLIGSNAAGPALLAQLAVENDDFALCSILRALGALGISSSQAQIERILTSSPSHIVFEGAARAWGALVSNSQTSPANPAVIAALWTAATTSPDRDAVAATYALLTANSSWKTLAPAIDAATLLQALQPDLRPEVLGYLVDLAKALPNGAATLRALAANPQSPTNVRVNALQLLSTEADAEAGLADPSPAVRVTALAVGAALPAPAVDADFLALVNQVSVSDPSPWVQGQALGVLAAFDPDVARPLVAAALATPSTVIQEAAISALGIMGSAADVSLLYQTLGATEVRLRAAAANAIAALPGSAQPANAHDVFARILANAPLDPNPEQMIAAVTLAQSLSWTDLAPSMVNIFPAYQSSAMTQALQLAGRTELLSGLSGLMDQAADPLVLSAICDPLHNVSVQAATSYQTLTGQNLSLQVRLNNVIDEQTPSAGEIDAALATHVVVSLAGGDLVMRMLPEAPITATKFVRRVKAGFYNGLIFHRVVPGFVAQGGDPTGLGSGGAPRFVRDEFSSAGHRRGTVGVATDGKDTGDCQFFINLLDNMFLDDGYTAFAEIESGLELIDGINRGDVIVQAYALE